MVKVLLFVVLFVAGADKPTIHKEEMPTAQDCADAVTDLITRAPTDFGGKQVLQLQAGCVLNREDQRAGG